MERFLKSKFKIGNKISENPFSLTYRGTTLSGEQEVVIKIYKRGSLNSTLIKVMKKKVRALQDLIHPGIARLYDGDYGWQGFYYVREYIKGPSLRDLLISQKRFEPYEAEKIMLSICEALKAAHAKGVIHGALKPENIFFENESYKLADFVIEGEVKEALPQKALYVLEHSTYLSPEEIEGISAGVSSDVYSAGLLLYEMLSGSPPFKVGNSSPMLKLKGKYEPLSSIPKYLEEILFQALERDPLLRFRKISDLSESLNKKGVVKGEKDLDLPVINLEDSPQPEESHEKKEKKRSFFLLILILLAFLSGIIYTFIHTYILSQ